MFAIFQRFLDWLRSLFWKEELELTLVGLQYSGKTTFVSVIAVCKTQQTNKKNFDRILMMFLFFFQFSFQPKSLVNFPKI